MLPLLFFNSFTVISDTLHMDGLVYGALRHFQVHFTMNGGNTYLKSHHNSFKGIGLDNIPAQFVIMLSNKTNHLYCKSIYNE